jgi:hypothetical protein
MSVEHTEVSGRVYGPVASSPVNIVHDTNWIGGWVGPREGLDASEKRHICWLSRESNNSPAAQHN